MSMIPHVDIVRAGWVSSDIIVTTSVTRPEQQTYSNVNVKRDPKTQSATGDRANLTTDTAMSVSGPISNISKAALDQTTRLCYHNLCHEKFGLEA